MEVLLNKELPNPYIHTKEKQCLPPFWNIQPPFLQENLDPSLPFYDFSKISGSYR